MKKFYIKQRNNPQFPIPYYVAEGRLTKKKAKELEAPVYGQNTMLPYNTEEEYLAALEKLRSDGFLVYDEN